MPNSMRLDDKSWENQELSRCYQLPMCKVQSSKRWITSTWLLQSQAAPSRCPNWRYPRENHPARRCKNATPCDRCKNTRSFQFVGRRSFSGESTATASWRRATGDKLCILAKSKLQSMWAESLLWDILVRSLTQLHSYLWEHCQVHQIERPTIEKQSGLSILTFATSYNPVRHRRSAVSGIIAGSARRTSLRVQPRPPRTNSPWLGEGHCDPKRRDSDVDILRFKYTK